MKVVIGKALIMNLVGEANQCLYNFERFKVCHDCAFLDHGVPPYYTAPPASCAVTVSVTLSGVADEVG